jgi:hypothetical protein
MNNPIRKSKSPGKKGVTISELSRIETGPTNPIYNPPVPGDKNTIKTYEHGIYDRSPYATKNTFGPNRKPVFTQNPLNVNPYEVDENGNPIFVPNPEQYTRPELEEMKTDGYSKEENVPLLKANRIIPNDNKGNYGLRQRGQVASVASRPYEEAEYAKLSCWEKLMECFKSKREKKRRGGSIGGADVTIEDLREFLEKNSDIKNILLNDECPLDPTEEMIDDADKFTDMLENYENRDITIDEIYNQEAGKRRKKTRKAKRRPRKTRKAKRRTKRRN